MQYFKLYISDPMTCYCYNHYFLLFARLLLQFQSFPNQYGECECSAAECFDVFGLCSLTRFADLFDSASATSPGPTLVPHPNLTIYNFDGIHRSDNWVRVNDDTKQAFLSRSDEFTVSFWTLIEQSSMASYIFSFELDRNRYFSMFDRSSTRLNVFYFRDIVDGFTSANDDGYNSQVALSFYYDHNIFPNGLRDGKWHFVALTVSYPNMVVTIDNVELRPTMGNYYNNIEQRVLLDQLTNGSFYNMPAPLLTKSQAVIGSIVGRVGGSGRGAQYSLHGQMRQVVMSSAANSSAYVCLASCDNRIDLAPGSAANFSHFNISYDPIRRIFRFSATTDAAGYTDFLQSVVYFTNGYLSLQESRESLRINLNISDEEDSGNLAEINLIGRSNQNPPVLVASGISVADINYQVDFREDIDEQVPILAPQAFIVDPDIESVVHNITVTLVNRQNGILESLTLLDNPPTLLDVTDANGNPLGAGGESDVIIIRSLDTTRVTVNRFITALVLLRYRNLDNEPRDVPRTIEFTVSDGRFFSSPRTVTTINILAVNDVPVVDLNGQSQGGLDASVDYDESGPPLNIVPNLLVLDSDTFMLYNASARIEQIFDEGNETIAVDLAMITSRNLTCIPASCNGTSLTIAGIATQTTYQAILRSLQYVNQKAVVDLPNLRDRRVFVAIHDGMNSSDPSQNVLINVVVAVTRVLIQLDAPLSKDYNVTFREAQMNPVRCSDTVRVLDTSLDTLETVVVAVRNVLPGGFVEANESIILSFTEGLDVSIEINTALKRITFSQVAPISQYVEAISRIFYFNGEAEPLAVNRFVDFLIIPGGGAPSDTSTCFITIAGINDHVPVCPELTDPEVFEDVAIGYEIAQLAATDMDEGVDGIVTYQLIRGDSSLFESTASGSVRLRGTLDYEDQNRHLLTVEACDSGNPQFCCQFNLTIRVRDSNDNPPAFSSPSYSYVVTENGFPVFFPLIITSDVDEGANGQLSMVEIDPNSFNTLTGCFNRFAVSLVTDHSILLSVVSPGLDYETATTCSFQIVVYDSGLPRLNASARIIISVIDVDDFSPEFSSEIFSFNVMEDNDFVASIGSVRATDRDSSTVTYSQSGLENLFSINQTTGTVFILFSSNYDARSQYMFTAIATDPAGNADNTSVRVNIDPINNSPPSLRLNGTSLNAETPFLYVEESPPILLALDPSIGDPDVVPLTITRIVVSVLNSRNPSSELLGVSDQSQYPFRLLSSDPGQLIIEPLRMTNLSDILGLLRSITYRSTEDELSECDESSFPCQFGLYSRTLQFTIHDGIFDSNRTLAYVQFELVNDPPLVDLDSTSSETGYSTNFIEQLGPVPIANPDSFFIRDEDNTNLTSLTCTISNPLDPSEELVISGSLPSGISVFPTSTRTQIQLGDSASIMSYEQVLSLIRYNSQSVNPDSADRMILVSVSDGLLESNIAIATISYVVRNDTPAIDLDTSSINVGFSVTFRENGDPVGLSRNASISDVDSDALQQLVVTIRGASSENDLLTVLSFSPVVSTYNHPTLTVTGIASIETYEDVIDSIIFENTADEIVNVSSRMIDFVVTDTSGESSVPVTTTVSIEPVDDNLPVFEPNNAYNFVVDENTSGDTLVGTVVVSDADLPPSTYIPAFAIISATPASGLSRFTISNNNNDNFLGEIRTVSSLDFEATPVYVLIVQVSSGNANVTATVQVNVVNQPDLPPTLECPAQVQVFENEPVSTLLGPIRCTASDPDNLDQVMFSIAGNSNGGITLVTINSTTGALSVAGPIDREAVGPSFTVTITAEDSTQSVSNNVTVVIVGVNEHDPVIEPAIVTLPENSLPEGGILLTVVATDPDELPDFSSSDFRSRITYEIDSVSPASGMSLFSINSTSGEIALLQSVDFENTSLFVLQVTANDNDPSLVARQTSSLIYVQVVDINDEPPSFVDLPDRIIVNERLQNGAILRVISITDPDSNASLVLSLLDPPPANFELDAYYALRVRGLLDAETAPREFLAQFLLTDSNTDFNYEEESSVSENVTLVILDANDNSPTFTMAEYIGSILEHTPATVVLNASATDEDYGLDPDGNPNGNNMVTYSFLGSDAPPTDKFAINPTTGAITTLQPLNREEASQYVFTVMARDNPDSDVSNAAFARVIINVVDVNEFAPVLDPSQYLTYIPESTSVGTAIPTYAPVSWNISGM